MLAVERSAVTQGILITGTLKTHGSLRGHIHRRCHVGHSGALFIRQSSRGATGGAHPGQQWTYFARRTLIKRGKHADHLGRMRDLGKSMELGPQKTPYLVKEVRLTDVSTQATGGCNTQVEEVSSQDHAVLTGVEGASKPPVPSSAEAEDEPLLASGDVLGVSSTWQLSRGKAELVLFLVPLLWGESLAAVITCLNSY